MANRPAKWTRPFLEALAECGVVAVAQRASGITNSQMYTYIKNHPEFSDQMEEAREQAIDRIEVKALEMAGRGIDSGMMKWVLARRRPEQYGDKRAEETSVATDKEAADFLRSIKDQLSDDGPESTPTDTSPEKTA